MLKYLIISAFYFLIQGCVQTPSQLPCDDFGHNCDPKVKINQWTAN